MKLLMCVALLAASPASGETTGPTARQEAKRLYEQGEASYETHDFASAIEAFTGAYELAGDIEDPESRKVVLARLRFNLARAHVSAFDVDADPTHLPVARRLLDDYRGASREEGRNPDEDTDIVNLERELALREKRVAEAGGPPQIETEGDDPSPVATDDRDDDGSPRKLMIAGASTVGVGALFLGLGATTAYLGSVSEQDFLDADTAGSRQSADREGQRRNAMAITGFAVGAAAVAAGTALLVVAKKKRSKERSAKLQVGFGASPTGAMGTVGGQF